MISQVISSDLYNFRYKMIFLSLRRCCPNINRFSKFEKITNKETIFVKPLVFQRTFTTTFYLHTFKFNKPSPKARPMPKTTRERNQTTLLYLISAAIATVGASYAAVPLYRVFCQSTSYGGTVKQVTLKMK